MIEVLHLIDTYRIGGPGKTIINSAKYIDRTRFRIHVGSFTDPVRTERNEFASAVRAEGIPYLDLPETRRVNLDHLSLIRGYVRAHDIAIVHAHGYRTDAISWAATRFMRGVAVVTTHHGWIRNNPRQDLMARGALQLCRRLDGVEVVSRLLLEELPRVVVRDGRAEVVHNAIVVDDYRPRGERDAVRRELGLAGDEPLLAVVGRLSVEKGCLEMLDAFAAVRAKQPRARLVFIGEGPLMGQLRERVETSGLSAAVAFLGHRAPVRRFYEAADVIVSPSRTEGLSNAILESLAVGRPIVATRVGGNPEILTHDVDGLLVDAGQPAALAAAILRVLDDPTLAGRLARQGLDRVQDAFSFEVRMAREQAFYAKILQRLNLDREKLGNANVGSIS